MNVKETRTRSVLGVGLAVLLLAGTVGCGSDDAASGPRVDEIDVSQPRAAELRDLIIEAQPGDLEPRGEDRIDPALFAEIEAVIAFYVDPNLRKGIVDDAVADWERTEILMGGNPGERGGQELNDERIAAILADLENGWEDLPLDTYLQLPAVIRLAEQASDDAALLAADS